MARIRANFNSGIVSGTVSTATAGTVVTMTGITGPSIPNGSYMPIILSPGYFGSSQAGEIAYVTAITSGNVATVTRAQENTTAVTGTGVAWLTGPLVSDFGLSNQIANADFPTPASGQVLVGTSTSGAAFTNTVSGLNVTYSTHSGGTFSGTITNGGTISGGNIVATITGSSIINSTISGATISGSTIGPGNTLAYSDITAGSNGQTLVTVSGSTVWANPVKVFTPSYSDNLTVTSTQNYYWGVGVVYATGYSSYLVSINGAVNATSSGGLCNLNLQTFSLVSGTLTAGPSGANQIFYVNTTIPTTWTILDTLTGFDPNQTYSISFVSYHNNGTGGGNNDFNLRTMYIKVTGIA